MTETTLEAPSALAEEAPLHPKLAKYQGDPVKLAEAYEHLSSFFATRRAASASAQPARRPKPAPSSRR